MHVTNN